MSFVRLPRVVFSVGAAALIGSLAVPARAATTTYDTNNTPYAGGTIDPGDRLRRLLRRSDSVEGEEVRPARGDGQRRHLRAAAAP